MEFCLLKHIQLFEEPLKIKYASAFFLVLCLLKNLTILLVYPSSINPIPRPIQKHMMNTKMFCELLHSTIGEDGLAQGGWHKHHKFSIIHKGVYAILQKTLCVTTVIILQKLYEAQRLGPHTYTCVFTHWFGQGTVTKCCSCLSVDMLCYIFYAFWCHRLEWERSQWSSCREHVLSTWHFYSVFLRSYCHKWAYVFLRKASFLWSHPPRRSQEEWRCFRLQLQKKKKNPNVEKNKEKNGGVFFLILPHNWKSD